MKITGIESAPAEVLEAFGRCEVCGEQATSLVRDIFEKTSFASHLVEVESAGLHRFCEEHRRQSKTIQVNEGPLGYMARMRAAGFLLLLVVFAGQCRAEDIAAPCDEHVINGQHLWTYKDYSQVYLAQKDCEVEAASEYLYEQQWNKGEKNAKYPCGQESTDGFDPLYAIPSWSISGGDYPLASLKTGAQTWDGEISAQWVSEAQRAAEYCAAHPHGRITLKLPTTGGRTLPHVFPCDFKPSPD